MEESSSTCLDLVLIVRLLLSHQVQRFLLFTQTTSVLSTRGHHKAGSAGGSSNIKSMLLGVSSMWSTRTSSQEGNTLTDAAIPLRVTTSMVIVEGSWSINSRLGRFGGIACSGVSPFGSSSSDNAFTNSFTYRFRSFLM